jgi:hypothetical protein
MLQEMLVTLTDILATHNRAAAQAFIRFMHSRNQGQRSAEQVKLIRRALNHSLSTYMLDAAAPDHGPDASVIDAWVREVPDPEILIQATLPPGPDECPIPENLISAVERQIENLARQMAEMERQRTNDTEG